MADDDSARKVSSPGEGRNDKQDATTKESINSSKTNNDVVSESTSVISSTLATLGANDNNEVGSEGDTTSRTSLWNKILTGFPTLSEYPIEELKEVYIKLHHLIQDRVSKLPITIQVVRQQWNALMTAYRTLEFGDDWRSEQTSDALDNLPDFVNILTYVLALSDNEERWQMGIEITQKLAKVLLEIEDYGFDAVNGVNGDFCPNLAEAIIEFWHEVIKFLPKEDSLLQEACEKLANVLGDYGELSEVLNEASARAAKRQKLLEDDGVSGGSVGNAITIN